jgi:predicted RNA binding protein YcfA (HicA-like mRNA interferase family)
MSQLEKLIELMLRLPPEVRIEDIRKLYLFFGWEERTGGKHSTLFVSPDGRTQTVPTKGGRKVKTTYLKRMIEDLDLEAYYENINSDKK